MAEGLKATVIKTVSRDGKVMEVREYPDHATRLKAADIVFKLLGAYREAEQVNRTVNYGVTGIQLDPEYDDPVALGGQTIEVRP